MELPSFSLLPKNNTSANDDASRYAAFISYRHVEPDRKWAKWLHASLETYRVPKKLVQQRGIARRVGRVFRDLEELPASADLSQEIETALRESRFLIVVCSPRTPHSQWVNKEIVRFREMGRHDRILALLIEGEPGEAFPAALREIRQKITDESDRDEEEIKEIEPLAADVRVSRFESARYLKHMARLRLLACILGCRFDDLRRREEERRKRRRANLGMASAVLLAFLTAAGVAIRSGMIRQQKAAKAAGLVGRLIDADTARVPAIVGEINGYRQWADPLLRAENARAAADSPQKLRTSLALLPVDAGQVDYLYGRLLTAEPNDILVLREALLPYKSVLISKLWSVGTAAGQERAASRLRASAALAQYDPDGPKWADRGQDVVGDLVRENPVFLAQWSEAFHPVRNHLLGALEAVYRDPRPERSAERSLATNLLGRYFAGDPPVLADLLMDADENQFSEIYPRLTAQAGRAMPILTGEIDKTLPPELPCSDDRREKLAKRQVNAAVALLRLNQPAAAWPLFEYHPKIDCGDPRARSYLIDRLGRFGVDPRAIARQLGTERDVTRRRALVLSLGGDFGERSLVPGERAALTIKLQELYCTDPDPGLHAAAEWLLRAWKQDTFLAQFNDLRARDDAERSRKLQAVAAATQPAASNLPQWYVNGEGQTMVVIPGPVEFMMGSPADEADRQENEVRHKVHITRTFAIAAKTVTFEQYRKYDPGYDVPFSTFSRMPTLPVVGIDWYMAAAYCNWLSQQEHLEPCYDIAADELPKIRAGESAVVIRMKENYLALSGYRLPTEAELEYGTRAGATTSRYYGETDELLEKYAWYWKNSDSKTQPVGTQKPNDLGFFDLHGNVCSWCQVPFFRYPAGSDELTYDVEQDLDTTPSISRVQRGGAFSAAASSVRSASRSMNGPVGPE